MKQKKAYSHLHLGAFLLMATYLFIVVTHLFFAPQFLAGTPGHHSAFRRTNDLAYILIRSNRAMSVESKAGKVFPKKLLVSLTSRLTHPKPLPHTLYGNDHISQFSPDLHSSYLSNRILRIWFRATKLNNLLFILLMCRMEHPWRFIACAGSISILLKPFYL